MVRADHAFLEHAEKVLDIVCSEAVLIHVLIDGVKDFLVAAIAGFLIEAAFVGY